MGQNINPANLWHRQLPQRHNIP